MPIVEEEWQAWERRWVAFWHRTDALHKRATLKPLFIFGSPRPKEEAYFVDMLLVMADVHYASIHTYIYTAS